MRKVVLWCVAWGFPTLVWGQVELSLDSALRMALGNSHEITASRARAESAMDLRRSLRMRYFPSVNLMSGYVRTNREISLLNQNILLPVIPGKYLNSNGELDQQLIESSVFKGFDPSTGKPILDPDYLNTFEIGSDLRPLMDENGNPRFKHYAYLPGSELSMDQHNLFTAGVQVMQPIWVGGRIIAANQMAQSGVELLQATVEVEEQRILLETERAYWLICSLEEKVKVVEEYLAMVSRLRGDVENLVREGVVVRTDLLKVQAKENDLSLNRLRTENGLRLARMNLCQMLGLPLVSELRLTDTLGLDHYILPEASFIDSAQAHRPELRMLEKTVELGRGFERMMRARFMPSIVAFGGVGVIYPNIYKGFEENLGGDWQVGVMLQFPLVTWGDRIHTQRMARRLRESAQQKYDDSRIKIGLQVQQAIFRLQEAQQRIEVAHEMVDKAEENIRLMESSLAAGTVKTSDVLESQAQWQEAQADLLDARMDLTLQVLELRRATGQTLRPAAPSPDAEPGPHATEEVEDPGEMESTPAAPSVPASETAQE